jgi:nanoRNase/pAp phosphatase (c-di-AMP/oligoRNAs hydrolase)
MSIYVLHHYPCMDGLGAKFSAWQKFKDQAIYIGVDYDKPIPEIESGSEIYILDFSYKKDVLSALKDRSSKLVVLDHHASAERELAGEPYAVFDMTQSGAVLAWKYFHPGVPVPKLLKHIQDRDLWQWKEEGTREVINALGVFTEDVSKWSEIASAPYTFAMDGEAISKYQDKVLSGIISEKNVRIIDFFGNKVALVQTNILHSEVGSELCRVYGTNIDFVITWCVTKDGKARVSLRSDGRVDVSKIAERLKGGGHVKASGAFVDLEFIKRLYK